MLRIKIKTLALFILGLAAAIAMGILSLPSLLYSQGQYDTLLKWFPEDRRATTAIYHLAEDALKLTNSWDEERIFIMSSGSASTTGNHSEEPLLRQEARKKLESLLANYPETSYSSTLKFNLAKLYMWEKEWDKAAEMFREIERHPGQFLQLDEMRSYVDILDSLHRREGAVPSIEGIVLIGDEPASNTYVVLQSARANGWYSPPFGHYPIALTNEEGRYQFYDIQPGEYEVGVGVEPKQIHGYVLTEGDTETITINGMEPAAFDFRFVPQVRLLKPVEHEVIDGDELFFQWEDYEGAEYYKIQLTTSITNKTERGQSTVASTSSLSDEKIADTEIAFSIEELRNRSSLKELSKMEEVEGETHYWPSSFLGDVYPGETFTWSVEAYDANNLQLSSSRGYFLLNDLSKPFFQLSDEGMLEGERLVLAYKYKEAMESLKKEGNHPTALRILARLAEAGISTEGAPD